MAHNVRIFNNVAVSAAQDYISEIFEADTEGDAVLLSLSMVWTGAPTGTFTLYHSNLDQPGIDPARNWTDTAIDFTGDQPAGSRSNGFKDVASPSASKYLLVYTHASGTGVIDCNAVAKVAGETGPAGPQGPQGPVGPAGSGGGGVGGGTLFYRPGGSGTGPVEYSSWPALMADVETLRTSLGGVLQLTIAVDQKYTTTPSIPGQADTASSQPTSAFSGPTADIMTFTDSSLNLSTDDIGRYVRITGATSGGNNGDFIITDVPSSDTIDYYNPAGVAEAAGSATYTLTQPWDMTGITLACHTVTYLDIADGCTFRGLRSFDKGAQGGTLHALSTTICPVTDFKNYGAEGYVDIVTRGVSIEKGAAGRVDFFDMVAAGPTGFAVITTEDFAQLGRDNRTIFNVPLSGQTLYAIAKTGGWWRDPFDGVVGATLAMFSNRDTLKGGCASFLGTITQTWDETMAGVERAVWPLPDVAAYTSAQSLYSAQFEIVRFDVSGGGFTQTLPTVPDDWSTEHPGSSITIVEESGTAGLLVQPGAGDTINGASGTVAIPAGGSIRFTHTSEQGWITEAINDPGLVGIGDVTLTYRPGGTDTGPLAFNSWTDLMAQLEAFRLSQGDDARYAIIFDDSAGAINLPTGTHDMTNVEWRCVDLNDTTFDNIRVNIPADVSLPGLRRIRGAIDVRHNAATGDSPIDDFSGTEVMYFLEGCYIQSLGIVPLCDLTSLSSSGLTVYTDRAVLGDGTNEVFANLASGEWFGIISLAETTVKATCLGGASGSTFTFSYGPGLGSIADQTTFSGTFFPVNVHGSSHFPVSEKTGAYGAGFNELVPCDPSGGGFNINLPALNIYAHGRSIVVKNNTDSKNAITLNPNGSDTVDGLNDLDMTGPYESVTLVPDTSGTNWIALRDTLHPYSPPEKWGQDNVTASQTNVDLSCKVSTNFSNIQAVKAGSIVGLSTRFSETLTDATADSIIATVTVNGTEGTLNVSHNSGTNADGGQATQAAGTDTFAAGDTLGISITTLGSFTPTTTDLEAWLEIV